MQIAMSQFGNEPVRGDPVPGARLPGLPRLGGLAACKTLASKRSGPRRLARAVAGVRAQGSYKRYLRAPHREFLRFRSLLVRGRAETNELHEKIARLPNGACWKVLSYWREDN